MLNLFAKSLDGLGSSAWNRGWMKSAKFLYRAAILSAPRWSVPWYNIGLLTKYQGEWQKSAYYCERATALCPEDEAGWWNLGIAATALRDWQTAKRAWKRCGIEIEIGSDGISMTPVTACVRLDPNRSGEVVWGTRIDPARIVIQNVPLPDSRRRFRDILLNDGAQEGTRKSGDREYPVFDELAIWQRSSYSTFQSNLLMNDDGAIHELIAACEQNQIGVEDWTTIRILCAACSKGSPEPHACAAAPVPEGARRFGFGSVSREILVHLLDEWASREPGRTFTELIPVLMSSD